MRRPPVNVMASLSGQEISCKIDGLQLFLTPFPTGESTVKSRSTSATPLQPDLASGG